MDHPEGEIVGRAAVYAEERGKARDVPRRTFEHLSLQHLFRLRWAATGFVCDRFPALEVSPFEVSYDALFLAFTCCLAGVFVF
jgi:hypothetical protein